MVSSCLSLVPVYKGYLRRAFGNAGLSPQFLTIDAFTTLHFWGPTAPNSEGSSRSGSSKSQPYKPALLLIHGFGPNAMWQWYRQVPYFANYFNLYVPELIFFGDSITTSVERTDVFQAKSLGKLMELLGVAKYYVMGTSYGGFISYHMASMWPERIEKVVIASAGLNSDYNDLVEIAKVDKIEDLFMPKTVKQLKALMSVSMRKKPHVMPDFFLNDLLKAMYVENREEKMKLLNGITIGKDEETSLSPLQQDVLIVWGQYDEIFRLERAFVLKEILGEHVTLEVVKNTAHMPHFEDYTRFNEVVQKFLCGPS